MKKLITFENILIVMMIFALICFFPLTGRDLYWANIDLSTVNNFIRAFSGKLFSSSMIMMASKIKILKIIMCGSIAISFMVLIKNIINKKNRTLFFLGLFLMLIIDKNVLAATYVNLNGFVMTFMSIFIILIFLNIFNKNILSKINFILLFLLGFIGTNIEPISAFIILIGTIVYLYKHGSSSSLLQKSSLLVGEMMGIFLLVFASNYTYMGISNSLVHSIVPSIMDQNFIITIIYTGMIFYFAMKTFNKGKRLGAFLAVICCSVYLFMCVLNIPNAIKYASFILYQVASLYILLSSTNNKAFKERISIYFILKSLYILLSAIFNSNSIVISFMSTLIDIIIILEIYNYSLPEKFLSHAWVLACALILGANIYVYKEINDQYDEMSIFIKNKFECTSKYVNIPERFENDYLYQNIPKTQEEMIWYIEYYDIDTRYNNTIDLLPNR